MAALLAPDEIGNGGVRSCPAQRPWIELPERRSGRLGDTAVFAGGLAG